MVAEDEYTARNGVNDALKRAEFVKMLILHAWCVCVCVCIYIYVCVWVGAKAV